MKLATAYKATLVPFSISAARLPFVPQAYASQGGALLAWDREEFDKYLLTHREYEENRHAHCEARFPVTCLHTELRAQM